MAKDTSNTKTPPVIVVNNQKGATPSRMVEFQIKDGRWEADTANEGVQR